VHTGLRAEQQGATRGQLDGTRACIDYEYPILLALAGLGHGTGAFLLQSVFI